MKTPAVQRQRRSRVLRTMNMKKYIQNIGAAYFWIVLYTIAPILCVLIASGIAYVTGSRLDEGNAHPSIILGVDIGSLLYFLFVSGWFMLLTIPTGLLALLIITIIWIVQKYKEKNGLRH
jgi:hypothetical protein